MRDGNQKTTKKTQPGCRTCPEPILTHDEIELLRRMLSGSRNSTRGKTVSRRQFSVLEFLLCILPKLGLVLLLMVAGALMAWGYAQCFVRPMYSATAKLFVLDREEKSLQWSDFQGGYLLAEDCMEALHNWEVSDSVRRELELSDSIETMQERLTVYCAPETQIISITYTCESPELAAEIANAYARTGKAFVGERMSAPYPQELSLAVVPGMPVGSGKRFYPVMGGLWGGILAVTIVFFRFALDDAPKTPEEIRQAAGIPTLAMIPEDTDNTEPHSKWKWRRPWVYPGK